MELSGEDILGRWSSASEVLDVGKKCRASSRAWRVGLGQPWEELCPLRPPVQPLKPRYAKYNSPPTLHLSLQHSKDLSLKEAPSLPWASADSGD